MDIVDLMLQYRKTRNASTILPSRLDIEERKLITIITEILSWLKLEYKRSMWIQQGRKTCLKPMQLDMKFPWCVELCDLVTKDDLFKGMFCIKENELNFADKISEEEREKIRKSAFDKYNPIKRS